MKGRGRGKVILLGEHAVVYGRPALAAALTVGAEATAVPAAHDRLRVPTWKVDLTLGAGARGDLATAFEALLATFGERRAPVEVCLEVAIPSGAGLGGSAASGVAIADAVGRLLGVEESREALAERALAWERVFHGNASGLDPAIAARGGVLHFVRRGARTEVPVATPMSFVVADSGERASTRLMVEGVAARWGSAPCAVEGLFDEVAALVEVGREALRVGDAPALGRALGRNQEILVSLGVSTPALAELCCAATDAGALGAKLTGSGGGGCVLALAPHREAAPGIARALERRGARTLHVEVGS